MYTKLRIYQLADKARDELYKELIIIPHHWKIDEVDQAIRSSSSVTSNIVEGYGRKVYQKVFYNYLSTALASSDETQNHIRVLYLKGYFSKDKADSFIKKYKNISIMILNMMNTIKENEGL